MRIKITRGRRQSEANNFTILSSTLRSTEQIDNTSDTNDEFAEFVTTTGYWKDIFNDTSSQNFTVDNAVSISHSF